MSERRALQTLAPDVLRWARERAGLAPERLAAKMQVKPDRLRDWESSGRISLAQADKMARHTRTPLGYLFLKAPPEEDLSIPDYRTFAGAAPTRPSPDLLDTIHLMRRRQAWMRDELVEAGADPLTFVGDLRSESSSDAVAEAMRAALSLPEGWAARQPDWTSALRHLRDRADEAGVLTVFNGIVGNNTSRKLDRSEFQGFALVDSYAPLVFVNAADFKTAQMFTLAHELAHIFVGAAGLSSLGGQDLPNHDTERFCNAVAAELLVPAGEMLPLRLRLRHGEGWSRSLALPFALNPWTTTDSTRTPHPARRAERCPSGSPHTTRKRAETTTAGPRERADGHRSIRRPGIRQK